MKRLIYQVSSHDRELERRKQVNSELKKGEEKLLRDKTIKKEVEIYH